MSDDRRPGRDPDQPPGHPGDADEFFSGSPEFDFGDALPGEDPVRAARRAERERRRAERAAKEQRKKPKGGRARRGAARAAGDRPATPRDPLEHPATGRGPFDLPTRAYDELEDLAEPARPVAPHEPAVGDAPAQPLGAPGRPGRPRFHARTLKRAALALAGVVLLVIGASLALGAAYADQALPGTTVAGVDVGGKRAAEIEAAIAPLADPERRITFDGPGDEVLRISAGAAGMQPDISGTVQAALDARRDSVIGPLRSLVDGDDMPLQAEVDGKLVTRAVKRTATEFDRSPYAGALEIDPQTRAVSTKPGKAGREVDQNELRGRLREALLRPGRTPRVAVPMRTAPAVSEAGLQRVAEAAERYLRTSLRITGAGKDYVVRPARLAPLLALEPLEKGRKARLGVDEQAVAALVDRVAAARDRDARPARISAPASGPSLTDKGRVTWRPRKASGVRVTAEAVTGRSVEQEQLEAAIAEAVRNDLHTVEAQTTTRKPPVTEAQARKVDSVIGTFTTPYVAGQPRVTNIQRMARSVDGTIIAPGQQFSLNAITGERTKAKGYVEAPFIAGNKIEPSVGGGVSQFATTMYNAAYFAGLQLDAWQAHSLYIDRYPPGRESTLNFPNIDVKWTNDTGAPVLVRTAYDSAGVTVTLYGDNGGRRVTSVPGERQPNPGGDFVITVTRVVTYADGRQVRQPVTTRYANEEKDEASND